MAVKQRSIRVTVTIQELSTDLYAGYRDIGSTELVVPLPVSATAIGTATSNAVEMLAKNADVFRGLVPIEEVVDA